MRQQSASHLWQDETEFRNDKGTTCLTKPATQSNMLPDTFFYQNYRRKTSCKEMGNTILW